MRLKTYYPTYTLIMSFVVCELTLEECVCVCVDGWVVGGGGAGGGGGGGE